MKFTVDSSSASYLKKYEQYVRKPNVTKLRSTSYILVAGLKITKGG